MRMLFFLTAMISAPETGHRRFSIRGSTSTCWAYAALGALSSELLPLEKTAYSVEAMTEHNAFGLPVSRGGDYTMAAAYFLSWDGPRDDRGNVKKHVQEIQFFDEDDREAIKWAVYQHGGVSTSIYADVNGSNLEKSSYYSKEDNAYCYRGKEEPNHDVVIIGWDDDYGAEHFPGRVPGDGAFICQNSWGESFGEEGVFYISYYDSNIGTQSAAYTKVENTDNYDTIYQSDLCGWVGSLGYNRERILAANVFEAQETQQIAAAGFYALGKNTTYQVYMVSNFQDVGSLAGRTPMASGAVENKGYYTIPFDYPVTVEKGSRFAVVIMLETRGSTLPMAVEYASDGTDGACGHLRWGGIYQQQRSGLGTRGGQGGGKSLPEGIRKGAAGAVAGDEMEDDRKDEQTIDLRDGKCRENAGDPGDSRRSGI